MIIYLLLIFISQKEDSVFMTPMHSPADSGYSNDGKWDLNKINYQLYITELAVLLF